MYLCFTNQSAGIYKNVSISRSSVDKIARGREGLKMPTAVSILTKEKLNQVNLKD